MKIKKEKKVDNSKIIKIVIISIIILLVIASIAYYVPLMQKLGSADGQLEFKNQILNSGIFGMLLLFALQIGQILLIILPGGPIEVIAGMCYGKVWGTIFILISSIITSVIIIALVKKFGRKFIYSFCNKEKVEKIENSKLFKNSEKLELIMFLLFLVPGTPKDLLTYLVGLLPIKPTRFLIITSIARIPTVVFSAYAGENIVVGDWKLTAILFTVIFAMLGIAMVIFKKFDKNNTSKEIFNIMKE